MGGRLLRAWLLRPLVTLERIHDRLDAVEDFAFRSTARTKLRDALKNVHDIERLVARAALGTAGPRDLVSLRQSIAAIPRVRLVLDELQAPLVRSLVAELDDLADVRDELDRTLLDEPPAVARDGGLIRDGVDPELDELRGISRAGKQHIARDGGGRARADRNRLAEDPLQPRLRVLHRGHEVEPARTCRPTITASRRLPAASASSRRRSRSTRRRCSAPTSGSSSARSSCSRRFARRVAARGAAHPGHGARRWRRSTCWPRWPRRRRCSNYTKPLVHAGDELLAADARHPVVERARAATRSSPTTSRSTATHRSWSS